MKLLLDENLSHRLCGMLSDLFPASAHVRDLNLQTADDVTIWEFAKEHDYVIVSKDEDFQQRSFVYGPPPKVIWVRLGNVSTGQILDKLRLYAKQIATFVHDAEASLLVLS